jgi:hypothetical protein
MKALQHLHSKGFPRSLRETPLGLHVDVEILHTDGF